MHVKKGMPQCNCDLWQSGAGKKVKDQEKEVADLKAKLAKLEKEEAAGRQARQNQEADLEAKVCAAASVRHLLQAVM